MQTRPLGEPRSRGLSVGRARIADLTRILGTVGPSAREPISVHEALRSAGALKPDLIVQ